MKILLLDIETAPNLSWTWGLWNQNIAPNQVAKAQSVLCWAAKWLGHSDMMFDSVHRSGEKQMLQGMHKLLDEADVVVHFYGSRFDIPMLNTEFIKLGMLPPSPYKQLDLKKVTKDMFRFPSGKLAFVSKALKIGQKLEEGVNFDLWLECLKGNDEAWKTMEEYNRQDVTLLEGLYYRYLPWISNHPNYGAYSERKEVCPNCGGSNYQHRGTQVVRLLSYPRFQCLSCGKWFRSNTAVERKKTNRYVGI